MKTVPGVYIAQAVITSKISIIGLAPTDRQSLDRPELSRGRYYIGRDVHKETITYSVKDASGQVHREGQIGATRHELDRWMKTLPQMDSGNGRNLGYPPLAFDPDEWSQERRIT